LVEADKTNKNWFPWQRPFGNRKANFRSFIYSRSSIDPAQLVKIGRGRVHVEIIGLTEIVKINMKRRQNTSPPWAAAAGGLMSSRRTRSAKYSVVNELGNYARSFYPSSFVYRT